MPDQQPRTARLRPAARYRYKNVAATLQRIERAQRGTPPPADGEHVSPIRLGTLQKIVAFGPLV